MAQPTFLGQLTQSGALNVANPLEAYKKAQEIKVRETNIKTAQLSQEGKALEIGRSGLKMVRDRADYTGYRNYMVGKLGLNENFLPESFETEEEFTNWQVQSLSSMAELAKGLQGKKVKFSKREDNGQIRTIEMTIKNFKDGQAEGLYEGFKIGTLTGKETPFEEQSIKKVAEQRVNKLRAEYEEENGAPPPPEVVAEWESQALINATRQIKYGKETRKEREAREEEEARIWEEKANYTQKLKIWYRDYVVAQNSAKGLTEEQKIALQKTLLGVEEKINVNPRDPGIQPSIDFFHRFSEKNYVYVWKDRWGKDEAVKRDLPPGVRAKDVWKTANIRNMPIADVLIWLEEKEKRELEEKEWEKEKREEEAMRASMRM